MADLSPEDQHAFRMQLLESGESLLEGASERVKSASARVRDAEKAALQTVCIFSLRTQTELT